MNIKTIHIFGDSFHDIGNFSRIYKGKFPSALYYEGRFTNGPIYCEYLIDMFNEDGHKDIVVKNYSFGLAMTRYRSGYAPKAPSLKEQIENSNSIFTDTDLVILGCGICNFLFFVDVKRFPYIHFKRILSIAKDLEACISKLRANGAKKIILFNLPDINNFPFGAKLSSIFIWHLKSSSLFKKLEVFISIPWFKISLFFKHYVYPMLSKSLFKHNRKIELFTCRMQKEGLQIEIFDAKKTVTDVVNFPNRFGFRNASGSIVRGVGDFKGKVSVDKNPNEYLFWDYAHFTTSTHKKFANIIKNIIYEKFS